MSGGSAPRAWPNQKPRSEWQAQFLVDVNADHMVQELRAAVEGVLIRSSCSAAGQRACRPGKRSSFPRDPARRPSVLPGYQARDQFRPR